MFNKNKIKVVVTIEGMSCNHCENKVTTALENISGVSKVKVDLKNKTALIISKEKLSEELITKTIEELDYKVINII